MKAYFSPSKFLAFSHLFCSSPPPPPISLSLFFALNGNQKQEHILVRQNVCFKFQKILWRKLKMLYILWHPFFCLSFSQNTHTCTHTYFWSEDMALHISPPWKTYYSGILEGWNIFSRKRWYSKIKVAPIFCISSL